MRDSASCENQEILRKRLIAAVTEICRNETFYEDEMRIEGTICLVSDRNSFVVFQITELVGAQSEDLPLFDNASNPDDPLTFANSHPVSDNKINDDNKTLDNIVELDKQQHHNSQLESDLHGCLVDLVAPSLESVVTNTNTNLSISDSSISNSFRTNDFILQTNSLDTNCHINNNKNRLSKCNNYSLNSKKRSNSIYRPSRHRRRISYNSNHGDATTTTNNNNNNNNNLLQNIKQEVPDFDLDISNNESLNLLNLTANLENEVNNLNPDTNNLKSTTKLFRSKKSINNNSVFSGRCYEEIYVRTPHGLYRYMCRLCNSMFKIRNGLYEHLNGHFGRRPHACRQCDAKFAHHSSLHNHVRNKHSVQTEEEKQAALRHICAMCGRRFRYPSELERHKAIHDEFPLHPTQQQQQRQHSNDDFSDLLNINNNNLRNNSSVNNNQQQDFMLNNDNYPNDEAGSYSGNIKNNNNNSKVGSCSSNDSLVDPSQAFEFQIFDHLANMSAIVDPVITGGGIGCKMNIPSP